MAHIEHKLTLVPQPEGPTPEMIQRFVLGARASNVPENFYISANHIYQICLHTTPEKQIPQKVAYDIFSIHWNRDEASYALAYAKSTSHAKILIRYMRKMEQTLARHDKKQEQLYQAQKDVTRKSNLPDRPAFWAVAHILAPKKFLPLEQKGDLQDEIHMLEDMHDQLNQRQDIYLGNVIDAFALNTLKTRSRQTGIKPLAIEHIVERHYAKNARSIAA